MVDQANLVQVVHTHTHNTIQSEECTGKFSSLTQNEEEEEETKRKKKAATAAVKNVATFARSPSMYSSEHGHARPRSTLVLPSISNKLVSIQSNHFYPKALDSPGFKHTWLGDNGCPRLKGIPFIHSTRFGLIGQRRRRPLELESGASFGVWCAHCRQAFDDHAAS